MKKAWIIFFCIVILGSFLRLYKISDIPPGINRDEGSIGYTAYSLLKTGQDEYGRRYPLSFQSFGDWKLPLYIYATVPLVATIGVNELSVRLISVLAGILTIILTYFLVKELFKKESLALLTMFLLSVAPWHIHLSRVESEANTAVMLMTLGTLLFLKSLKKNNWFLTLSSFCFALTYYTYAGNYVFTTLLILGLVLLYYPLVLSHRWKWFSLAVFIVLSGIIFSQTLFSANKTKLSGISIFGDPAVVHAQIEIPRNEYTNPSSLPARLFHNRIVFALERTTQNYLNSFSPNFLFISGGTNKAHNIEGFGNMYLVESLFLIAGFIYLITSKKGKEEKLVLWWFLISPVAASITKDAPHTNRMLAIFPILPLLTAFGIMIIFQYTQKFISKKIVYVIIAILFAFNIGLYLDQYFIHFPRNEVQSWGAGYEQLNGVLETKYKVKHIVMTRPSYSPYIFLLFYSRYDPAKYIKEAVRYPISSDGFVDVKSYGRYEFRQITWEEDIKKPNTILVADPSEVPASILNSEKRKSSVVLPNNKIMFVLIET